MGAYDIQIGSVTLVAVDTTVTASYALNAVPRAFAAASIVVDCTSVTGTWTVNVWYNGAATTNLLVFTKTAITAAATYALTPQAPFSTAGGAIPSALTVAYDNTSAGTLSATVRLLAVT